MERTLVEVIEDYRRALENAVSVGDRRDSDSVANAEAQLDAARKALYVRLLPGPNSRALYCRGTIYEALPDGKIGVYDTRSWTEAHAR